MLCRFTAAWSLFLARLWVIAYRIQHQAGHYGVRYGKAIGAGTFVIFVAASAYPIPRLQAWLETWFADDQAVQRVQDLLVSTGAALIGATAIVTSLVLFAMQVNVERMPHRLFRRLSEDRNLLFAFASGFVLAVAVTTLSAVVELDNLAVVLVASVWAILLILALFLYAYRRALRLINPLDQLQMLLDDARRELRRWARQIERVRPLLVDEDQAEIDPSGRELTPDAARAMFFRLRPHWTAEASRSVQYAMAFARRYAEQGDYEVASGGLTAVVGINAAYIEAKGKTFYSDNLLIQNPLAHDKFITESLEHLRQNVEGAIRRRDERQIEQSLQAIGALVPVYLGIDYANSHAGKYHAQLAARYLANAVQAVVPHNLTDVLMEGQRILGGTAQQFLAAGEASYTAVLSEKVATLAGATCVSESNRPVTLEGVQQLANLTLVLLQSPSHNAGDALRKVHENVVFIAKWLLQVPSVPLGNIHASTLAPYYSSSDFQSLQVHVAALVDAAGAAEADDENARTVIRNLKGWSDGLYRTTKELLLESIAVRSHFTIHMFQWMQGLTEILLAASNAPACDPHTRLDLRKNAGSLIGAIDGIPNDEETVTFVETFNLTEILFEAAMKARDGDCDDIAADVDRMLVSWAFKGGRYITGWGVLERSLSGCAALALTAESGAVAALKSAINGHLQGDGAPAPEVRVHGAHGLRRRAQDLAERSAEPSYILSIMDQVMEDLDYRSLATLLKEIAEMLDVTPQPTAGGPRG